jgi:hypothetical protein
MRRGWAVETRTINRAMAAQTTGDSLDRLVAATSGSNAGDTNPLLLHRYETRLHMMYQRALHNLLLLRNAGIPNEPNPISEHDPASEAIIHQHPNPEPRIPNPDPRPPAPDVSSMDI